MSIRPESLSDFANEVIGNFKRKTNLFFNDGIIECKAFHHTLIREDIFRDNEN